MKWKLLRNEKQIDLVEYTKQYLIEKPDTKIFIGTDSQNNGRFSKFAYVIVFYNEKKGGHIIYSVLSFDIIRDRFQRLLKEVEYSIQIADTLRASGISRPITIDIDLNTDKKYFSNTVLTTALGWVTSLGYECRTKPYAAASSKAADKLCH